MDIVIFTLAKATVIYGLGCELIHAHLPIHVWCVHFAMRPCLSERLWDLDVFDIFESSKYM